MENDVNERLQKNEEMLEKIFVSVEKTRKYIFWTMVTTLVVFVLPLLGLLVAIPSFIRVYSEIGSIAM